MYCVVFNVVSTVFQIYFTAANASIYAFLRFFNSTLHNIISMPLVAFRQKQRTAEREELILSQLLSSTIGKNIGRAGNRTSDLLFSSLVLYRLSYGGLKLRSLLLVIFRMSKDILPCFI